MAFTFIIAKFQKIGFLPRKTKGALIKQEAGGRLTMIVKRPQSIAVRWIEQHKTHLRKVEMLISLRKFFTLTAAVHLLLLFLVWNRPCAIPHPRMEIINSANVVKSVSNYLPPVDITPAFTGEDAQIFQKNFNPSNKVYYTISILCD
jgi:hypothetical protein